MPDPVQSRTSPHLIFTMLGVMTTAKFSGNQAGPDPARNSDAGDPTSGHQRRTLARGEQGPHLILTTPG